ncbi:MAG: hypothetical protein UV73_C0012G0005 [Candidatus Gottesmanbacteria bacterium GW2011_GWA2_43_14]|uniref:Uncharacterized protein n=1 Tax=Candidatus Gottesmanbacteria bacterium GW2011_GWA2_43_14 TaxID=1618443 RepID=A0A0G1DEC9_9BACT|nr:MAG: hypothetical protein UV73_C0012G0005 [Candidatus Gottesmanbacteria bacterium GW2011_GWA2_43_14]
MNFKKILVGATAGAIVLGAVTIPVFAKPADRSLNGGGEVVEDNYKISFGGNIKEIGEALKGQFEVNFHNVSNSNVSGGKFHSTEISDVNWFAGEATCKAAMNVTMSGKFNGEEGYTLVVRAGDDEDTVRFTLTGPGVSYDTYPSDFTGESSCVGTARTGIDNGSITIK